MPPIVSTKETSYGNTEPVAAFQSQSSRQLRHMQQRSKANSCSNAREWVLRTVQYHRRRWNIAAWYSSLCFGMVQPTYSNVQLCCEIGCKIGDKWCNLLFPRCTSVWFLCNLLLADVCHEYKEFNGWVVARLTFSNPIWRELCGFRLIQIWFYRCDKFESTKFCVATYVDTLAKSVALS